jgi:hypothetical protein
VAAIFAATFSAYAEEKMIRIENGGNSRSLRNSLPQQIHSAVWRVPSVNTPTGWDSRSRRHSVAQLVFRALVILLERRRILRRAEA